MNLFVTWHLTLPKFVISGAVEPPAFVLTMEAPKAVGWTWPDACEVKNWESMGGLAAYAMKVSWVSKQLEAANNVQYLDELAAFVKDGVTKKAKPAKAS